MQSRAALPLAVKADRLIEKLAVFDAEGSGGICLERMMDIFHELGLPQTAPEAELRGLLLKFRTDTSSQVDYFGCIHWLFEPTEEDLRRIFAACDTDGDGQLCLAELRYALQACGLFPTTDQIITTSAALRSNEIGLDAYSDLQARMRRQSAIKKDFPSVPYAGRGVTLAQLRRVSEAFLRGGWLRKQCDDHNQTYSLAYDENLYALDRFLVRKVTSPESCGEVPEDLRRRAELPEPARKSSYAELVNPLGLTVHYFVSHFWGHLFSRTLTSLEGFAASEAAVEPATVVFWICLFALNQHNAAQEMGSSPAEGPFNAALAKAASGVVMVMDEEISPIKRIWCLYEAQRLSDLGKGLTMLGEDGPLAAGASTTLARVADAIGDMRAIHAEATEEEDRSAILYRILDPVHRRDFPSDELFRRGMADMQPDWFSEFDAGVAKIFGTALLPIAVHAQDVHLAMRCLGWGACARDAEAFRQVADLCGGAPALREVRVQTKWSRWPVSLLHVVARDGNVEAVKFLCEARASLEAATTEAEIPVHAAGSVGHADTLQSPHKAGTRSEAANTDNTTPVHIAAMYGHAEVLQLLHRAGASLEVAGADGMTPVALAVLSGHAQALQVLLEAGASIGAANASGWAPAHDAALAGHVQVLQLLREAGASLQAADTHGTTPAHVAGMYGHAQVLQLLLEAGTSPEAAAADGTTLAHSAAMGGHGQVLQVLRERGASLQLAKAHGTTPTHLAAEYGHAQAMQLLVEAEADLEATDGDGLAPAELAASAGHAEVLRLLREAGASLEAAGADGRTPAHAAACFGHTQVLQVLCEPAVGPQAAGAGHAQGPLLMRRGTSTASLESVDTCGTTPAHCAALNGHAEVLQLLREEGTSLEVADAWGATPAHCAACYGHGEVLRLLSEAGASLEAADLEGRTPSDLAAGAGHTQALLLLHRGAEDRPAGS